MIPEGRLVMLPGDPGFAEILHGSLPPTEWKNDTCFVARAGSKVLEAVPFKDAIEYAYGGEYDEVDGDDEEWDE